MSGIPSGTWSGRILVAAAVLAIGAPAPAQPTVTARPAGVKRRISDPKPARAVTPGLRVGDPVPAVTIADAEGKPVKLSSLYEKGPIVVTFYRGGWCPFCQRALRGWRDKIDDLKAAGATFVAIAPEKRDYGSKTREDLSLNYPVYTDETLEAARGFKVLFTLEDELQKRYKGFGIDLPERNASGTWQLPAPGTFVVDRSGTVRYAFADWDYKKRADPEKVIAAVRALK